MQTTNAKRYDFLDLTRGIAVILMIFFHLFYDLSVFKFVDINFQKDFFWYWLPRLIVTLFLFSVGPSLIAQHRNYENWKKSYTKRLLKIGIGAILISLFTYFAFRPNWIYFGTLHCIFFITILVTPFLQKPITSLIIALIIFTLYFTPYAIPFFEMKHASMDYIPLFPWIGITFLSIYLEKFQLSHIPIPKFEALAPVLFLGKNSFYVYIIHQPILYGLVYLSYLLFGQ